LGGEARLPFRLQAVLIGLICFSAGGVPRLVRVLFGLLALIAAFHVFTVEPELPVKLFKTAFGFALALFIAYLFINALWAPERAAALVKAVTVLGLAAGAFLIAASYSLRSGDRGARAGEMRSRRSPARGGVSPVRDRVSRVGDALHQQPHRAGLPTHAQENEDRKR
jgi:hypothetical protein